MKSWDVCISSIQAYVMIALIRVNIPLVYPHSNVSSITNLISQPKAYRKPQGFFLSGYPFSMLNSLWCIIMFRTSIGSSSFLFFLHHRLDNRRIVGSNTSSQNLLQSCFHSVLYYLIRCMHLRLVGQYSRHTLYLFKHILVLQFI